MNKLAVALTALAFTFVIATPAFARGGGRSHSSTVHVSGHTTKNGTYVPAHTRSAPNKSKTDNWSTKGNVNPYTGKTGTKDPYQN